MLENTEHLRDSSGDLVEVQNTIHKTKRWLFTIFWNPEDIVNYMNKYREYQNNILKK